MFNPPPFMDAWQARAKDFVDNSPLKDFEKNARAWFEGAIAHFNLVQRSELDTLSHMIEKMADKIATLETRIDDLEKRD